MSKHQHQHQHQPQRQEQEPPRSRVVDERSTVIIVPSDQNLKRAAEVHKNMNGLRKARYQEGVNIRQLQPGTHLYLLLPLYKPPDPIEYDARGNRIKKRPHVELRLIGPVNVSDFWNESDDPDYDAVRLRGRRKRHQPKNTPEGLLPHLARLALKGDGKDPLTVPMSIKMAHDKDGIPAMLRIAYA